MIILFKCLCAFFLLAVIRYVLFCLLTPAGFCFKATDETSNDSKKGTRKSGHLKETRGRKNKHSRHSSSDDEGLEKIKRGSRRKNKWYDSEEGLSSSSDSGSESELDGERKRYKSRKREKKRRDKSDTEHKSRSKKKAKSKRNDYSSESGSLTGSENEKSSGEGSHHRGMLYFIFLLL